MKFTTIEELSKKYPLGTVISTEKVNHKLYCAHDVIFNQMKEYYGENNVQMISPHHAQCTHYVVHTVDGYMYDGDTWYPMEHLQGNWITLELE